MKTVYLFLFLIISFILIAAISHSERSSCQTDFKTKTIYVDSPDDPAFWTLKTIKSEWGCMKKKRKK